VFQNMGITEYAVKHAIEKLSKKEGTFTCEDIADEIRCNRKTVNSAVLRLIESGVICRTGCKRNGYRYEQVVNAHH